MNADGSTDAVRRAAVARDFEVAQKRVAELLERHEKLNRELFEEQLRFAQRCNRAAGELGGLVTINPGQRTDTMLYLSVHWRRDGNDISEGSTFERRGARPSR